MPALHICLASLLTEPGLQAGLTRDCGLSSMFVSAYLVYGRADREWRLDKILPRRESSSIHIAGIIVAGLHSRMSSQQSSVTEIALRSDLGYKFIEILH